MPSLIALYGSPRRKGNTATLLRRAVTGARGAGAEVEEVVLRDLKLSPCLEIYGCKQTGRCVISDDFGDLSDRLLAADGIILASPIFFYTVSAHTKILMDRCQSLWVRKYWIEGGAGRPPRRKGLFISVGATHGKRLFDGARLTVRYFFDTLDTELWRCELHRGIDFEGDIEKHPAALDSAEAAGAALVAAVQSDDGGP